MITIIFAPPRYGKTALLVHLLNLYAYNYQRIKNMQEAIVELNNEGFNFTIPNNCVSANFEIKHYKFGCSPKKNRIINPYRLGYDNPFVDVHVNMPYEAIGIQEAQKYYNSRRSANFPDWQSRWFEQHGHIDMDIIMDTQRPGLIDPNIRALAQFIEVVDMKPIYNEHGDICSVKWNTRHIKNESLLDLYFQSGKRNPEYYEEKEVIADYNVFNIYDSKYCKKDFYKGCKNKDFNFNEVVSDEKPENYYKSKTKEEKKVA